MKDKWRWERVILSIDSALIHQVLEEEAGIQWSDNSEKLFKVHQVIEDSVYCGEGVKEQAISG